MNKKIYIIGSIIVVLLIVVALMGGSDDSVPSEENMLSTTTSAVSTTTDTTTATTTASVTATSSTVYTMTEVATHKDATSCWSAINGKVYDLTKAIDTHPGGREKILSICGKDGSTAFGGQHGGQPQPEAALATMYIGELAK